MDELTREFLIESQEGLDRMERCLTDLEERPNDAALLADIFRSVHTIKGNHRLPRLQEAREAGPRGPKICWACCVKETGGERTHHHRPAPTP